MNKEKSKYYKLDEIPEKEMFVSEDCSFKSSRAALCLKKNLGLQLFCLRQERNYGVMRVSNGAKISPDILNDVELGRGILDWYAINNLLEYYGKRIKVELVNRETNEERMLRLEQEKQHQELLKSSEIIARQQSSQAVLNDLKAKIETIIQNGI